MKANTKIMRTVLLSAAALTFSLEVSAQLYRYVDENGRTVMSAIVPPHIVPKGYDVLSGQGRLIERVPPALSEEQIRVRDAKIEAERLAEIARKEQVVKDQKLLKQYGSADSAVHILKRRLAEIDSVLVSRRAAIAAAEKSIVENEKRAAESQRNGKAVPKRVTDDIAKARADIENSRHIIAERQETYQQVVAEFSEIVRRLEIVAGKKATISYP